MDEKNKINDKLKTNWKWSFHFCRAVLSTHLLLFGRCLWHHVQPKQSSIYKSIGYVTRTVGKVSIKNKRNPNFNFKMRDIRATACPGGVSLCSWYSIQGACELTLLTFRIVIRVPITRVYPEHPVSFKRYAFLLHYWPTSVTATPTLSQNITRYEVSRCRSTSLQNSLNYRSFLNN